MILWRNLTTLDIMKAAVMVTVGLVVIQIVIIGEEIVSLVSSTEFWRSISWSMGLILVPLINSSKQKLTYRVYHDLDYTEIPDNTVSSMEISVNPILLDGWITRYKLKTVQDVNFSHDAYFVSLPKFDSKTFQLSNNNNWSTEPAEQICRTWMNGSHQTELQYTDLRPYCFYYDAGDAEDTRVKDATIDVMRWVEKGESFKHRIAYGADGAMTAGSIKIYAEYTHVIANFNDNSKANPQKTNTFMTIAWNGTSQDAISFNFNTGLRLIGTELYVTNLASEESIFIGKNLTGSTSLSISSDSVNDYATMPEDNQIIKIDGSMYDSPSTSKGDSVSMSYYHKYPLYYHKGESMTMLYYNESNDMNLIMTSQVLFNYQDQHIITHKDTFADTNDSEIFIRIPCDMFIETIETEVIVEEDAAGSVRQGELYIYGMKHENWAVDSTRGAHLNNANFEGLMQHNIIDTMMYVVQGDSQVGQNSSYCSPQDYYPQGSIIWYKFNSAVAVDDINILTQIKGRNARKQSNRDALQFWRNDNTVFSLNGGVQ